MLQHIEHEFRFPGPVTDSARQLVLSYAGVLVAGGYVARKAWNVRESERGTILAVTGVGAARDCLSAAASSPHAADYVLQLRNGFGAVDCVRYDHAPGTGEVYYAPDPPWAELQLVCDCILGISPLRTADGRFVARFRPSLDVDMSVALWTWDVEYDSVYQCWLVGGSYETWAERELRNSGSKLNETGRVLAENLSRTIGCPVSYAPHGWRQ